MKIKICGITNSQDAEFILKLGAWAMGFIFVKSSPRYIEPIKAAKITEKIPSNFNKVGVFVNSSIKEILETIKMSNINKIQLHGEESPLFCREISELTGLEVIKALKIKDITCAISAENYIGSVSYLLLDSYDEKLQGGTGKTFDWKIARNIISLEIPVILAGGITFDNINLAFNELNPYAFDISSGVEKSPGIKDFKKLEILFSQIIY